MITLINTTRLGRLTPAAADDDRRSDDQRTRDAALARADSAATLATVDDADARRGLAWYNGLTDTERGFWLKHVGTFIPADCWAAFKRTRRP